MCSRPRFYRSLAGYLAVIACLLLVSGFPARPAAAVEVDQMIDNDLGDFSDGTFLRAALSSTQDARPILADEIGAVQLAPSGKLNDWGSTTPLPEAVSDAGFTALGKRLYVIGGSAIGGSSGSTGAVHWATVNTENGNLVIPDTGNAWQNLDPLPPTKFTNDTGCDTLLTAERTGAGVTSISTGGDTGFLYVIGGSVLNTGCNSNPISSIAVQIGRVGVDGRISWSNGPDFPSPEAGGPGISDDKLGIQDAAVASVRTSSGKVFIYVFGGLQRYQRTGITGDPVDAEISPAVFYAEVNLINGSPGPWLRGPDIPVPTGSEGLWDGTAVAARFDIGGGGFATRDAIYVTGGQIRLAGQAGDFNARVWRADVNPATGALTWVENPGEGAKPVSLPAPVLNMAAVSFNAKLYMVGGAPSRSGSPLNLVPTAIYLEDMSLDEIDGLPDTFFQGGGVDDSVLPAARQNHGVAIVRADATEEEPSAAWVYVAGGLGSDGLGTSTLFLGKIGGLGETDADIVAPSGWYYSAPVSVRIGGAQVQVLEIKWSTQIDRNNAPNADIKMEYRLAVTDSGLCDGDNVFSDDSWRVITDAADLNLGGFFSTDGANAYGFPPNELATCFQYRAFFTRAGGSVSPSLLNVSLKTAIRGSTDLKVKELSAPVANGNLLSIEVIIENKNEFGDQITQPADFEARGGFWVDLCISEPNQPLDLPTLPLQPGINPPCSKAYAEVNRSLMQPNTELVVSGWRDQNGEPIDNLLSLFDATGTYELAVIIDADNLVAEGDGITSPQEQNNIGPVPPLQISITVVPPESIIRLPLMRLSS